MKEEKIPESLEIDYTRKKMKRDVLYIEEGQESIEALANALISKIKSTGHTFDEPAFLGLSLFDRRPSYITTKLDTDIESYREKEPDKGRRYDVTVFEFSDMMSTWGAIISATRISQDFGSGRYKLNSSEISVHRNHLRITSYYATLQTRNPSFDVYESSRIRYLTKKRASEAISRINDWINIPDSIDIEAEKISSLLTQFITALSYSR